MKIVSLLQGSAEPKRVDFIEGRLNSKIKLIGDVTLIAPQVQVREELAHLA